MITSNGINHLAFATGDMETTIRFWRDLLGMRLVAGIGKPGARHYFFALSETDMVAFFKWPAVKASTPAAERLIFPGEGRVLADEPEDQQ